MMVNLKRKRSVIPLAVLLTLAAAPKCQLQQLEASITQPALAQTADPNSFPMPKTVAEGTKVAIDGSSSMETINEALKQSFEKQFPGTDIRIASEGTDAALQALREGKIDLVAIGRPLTDAEKAEGLVAVPISRNKIAIIVGPDNPFNGSLTIEQFARIFRGEITDWSQVGGAKGPVRLVDRPESSDTRQAFLNYPVFQKAPFKTGANAVQVAEDRTSAVIEKLGTDGVGYAIADQVVDQPGVRVVQMHKTLPTDPRYPFSQPLSYVYKGPTPNPGVKAFLGYALTPESQRVVEQARQEAVKAPEERTTAPAEVVPAPETGGVPPAPVATKPSWAPLWWLLLPLLGLPLLLWWALGRGVRRSPVERPSQIVLTPRNCRDAYAYWELSEDDKKKYQKYGKKQALRLYDVTDINLDYQQPHSVRRFECDYQQQRDMHLPIEVDNRDYLVELGFINSRDEWVSLARSKHVRVPQCSPVATTPVTETVTQGATPVMSQVTAAGAAATAVAAGRTMLASDRATAPEPIHETEYGSQIILTPRNSADAYVYWEVSGEHKTALRRQGGQNLMLRLYDVTDINSDYQEPHAMYEFECDELDKDRHLPIRVSDRDYLVELGYTTADGHWLRLARSNSVRVASEKTPSSF
jgi:phosphate transport system substrate-binding protein